MALTKISDKKPPQMKAVVKEQELTEKNKGFLQNIDAAEGARQNLLREFTRTDPTLDRSDEEDVVSENPQTGFLHDLETKQWDTLELEAGHGQDLQNEQDEQERDCTQHEEPQVPTSVPFSDESIPELSQKSVFFQLNHWNTQMGLQGKELGADSTDWMEKIKNIIHKINVTENTVKSLLSEVMSLEGQIEKLESHQDLDPDQGSNIENFCKDMTLLNTKLGMYQVQEGKTDSHSPEEMAVEGREPLLPQAPLPPLVQNAPPRIAMWKRVLSLVIMFCILTFTGLSCYILFFDATFIFERVLPVMLGRRRMWELREIIAPFLNLEVEDLLPS
ncbi:single-pass membrane and coiled-coil domain-containing protein 2 isoform X5 [Vicugna pacos]|uniref:Single-pass membrane and coiled-coil domain-containing protein 2 isoform X5 n=1 Tax=Vicugna pacos TaxID=30538 RepID=A0ABM5CPZ7_VICPA